MHTLRPKTIAMSLKKPSANNDQGATRQTDAHHTAYLVIGSGLAGLFFALKTAEFAKVTVLSKAKSMDSATALAQGGIASVASDEDTFEDHIRDTIVAGTGLCHEDVVRLCVEEAPHRIQNLIDFGVLFEGDLTREGGHSHRRIFHSFDQTGLAIQTALVAAARKHPNITLLENRMAIDLILDTKLRDQIAFPQGTATGYEPPAQCLGAYILNMDTNQVETWTAHATVLATGGAGKVYLYTSNWEGATGDGIAIAKRAGCRVANMEFLQFHPTCLYHPQARNFLITEAMRGEGAELKLADGTSFMKKYHPMGSLAPRDIVARAIDAEIKRTGSDCVYLDARHMPREELKHRFPVIFERCLSLGIDISRDPIPVVPAAHYLCGGILTDKNGRTDVQRLFAVGENACTGLHGANRLASNSLMEATVFSERASRFIREHNVEFTEITLKPHPWNPGKAVELDEMIVVSHNWDEVRRLMWNYVGIVRSDKRLERALHRIEMLQTEIREYYWNFKVEKNLLELRNIALVAELMIRSALSRKESRGIHYNIDYPETKPEFAHDTVL